MISMSDVRWWSTWLVGSVVGWGVGFIVAFAAIGGVLALIVDDVDAVMEGPVAFAIALTLVFAAGGACLGVVQWLHLRRLPGSTRWIGLTALGFATIAITFNAILLAIGDGHLDHWAGRLGNELAHGVATGAVMAWVAWRFLGERLGVERMRWMLLIGLAFPATGLAIWGLESAFRVEAGDVAPLGMLVAAAFFGTAWSPLTRRHRTRGPDTPNAMPA